MFATWAAKRPMCIDFSCGFQAKCCSGNRSRTLRVSASSNSKSSNNALLRDSDIKHPRLFSRCGQRLPQLMILDFDAAAKCAEAVLRRMILVDDRDIGVCRNV